MGSSIEETSGPTASVSHLASFPPTLKRSNHVFPSPQSHGATVSEDGLTGSRTAKSARRRIRLESRGEISVLDSLEIPTVNHPDLTLTVSPSPGWLPVPRWTRWPAATGLRAAVEGPEAGSVHPGARVGALTLE